MGTGTKPTWRCLSAHVWLEFSFLVCCSDCGRSGTSCGGTPTAAVHQVSGLLAPPPPCMLTFCLSCASACCIVFLLTFCTGVRADTPWPLDAWPRTPCTVRLVRASTHLGYYVFSWPSSHGGIACLNLSTSKSPMQFWNLLKKSAMVKQSTLALLVVLLTAMVSNFFLSFFFWFS